jgi:hypothetical protein
MRRLILFVNLALFLTTVASADEPITGPQVFSPKPFEPREGAVNASYAGFVTGITKDSITIQWTVNWVVSRDVKPKEFLVSEALAAGKVPIKPRPQLGARGKYPVEPSYMYRLQDVQVGDGVSIAYARIDGVDICDHICIKKRPGGRVPRLPEEAEAIRKADRIDAFLMSRKDPEERKAAMKEFETKYIRWDEFINAYWDLEDKGIPFPKKFGANRRWPVAPMPRKLTLDTPRLSQ